MEAIFTPSSSADQSIPHYKQIKNSPKRNTRRPISRSTENLAPMNSNNNIHGGGGGVLFASPPSLSFSCPPSFSVLYPHQQIQRQRQPPLLPLPISRPYNSLPCPPPIRKTNRTRDQSLTPKKFKQPITRKETEAVISESAAKSLIIATTLPFGPDPNDLPKNVSKVLSSSPPSSFLIAGTAVNDNNTIGIKDYDRFSGTVFTLSPPPSSLPLPKFSIRPKLISCTAEAAGIDAGATDNLRRLLRLR